MACLRCGGLMESVLLEDRESTYCKCPGLRCLSCGDILDDLIAQHRAASVKPYFKKDSAVAVDGSVSSDYRYEHWSDGI